MKILVFTSLYPNNVWPNNNVFVKERMTKVARQDRCEVKIVAPVPYFPPLKLGFRWYFSQVLRQENIEGVEVYHPRYFMVPKVGMALHGLMMFISTFMTVRNIYKQFEFDLIDAHYVYPDGLAAVLLGQYFQKPVVVSARGSDINSFAGLPLIRKLLQYTLGKADRIIAVCQALKDAMIKLDIPAEKIAVIPNGVDATKFYPIPKSEARRQLGLSDDRIILSVGGLIPRKRFDLIIKAVKILCEDFQKKNLLLIIIGEGGSRNELERLITSLDLHGHVRLQGSVSHRKLYIWYNAADLSCLASSREGWPNVVLESLACGTPVVATRVWGTPEIIRSDEFGILTERNESDIALSIAEGFNKRWHHEAIVQYAQDKTWEQVANSVIRVFRSAIDRKSLA